MSTGITTPSSYAVVSNKASSNGVNSLDSEDCASLASSTYQTIASSQYPSEACPQVERGSRQIRKIIATVLHPSNTYWNHELRLLGTGFSKSISPQPTADPTALNLSLLLRSVRDFAEWSFQTPALSPTETTQLTHPASEPFTLKNFWRTLKNCIYHYKINDLRHAIPLLSHLLSFPPTILPTTPSLNLLQQFLASFSPVNFRRNPLVRLKLLTHLHALLSTVLGSQHLLTKICHQLLFDNGTRHATETALSCLHSSLVLAHDSLAFQTERAIIALLRRDGCLDEAARKAKTLLFITRSAPDPDYRLAREAAQELAHVYMDTGQLDEAKGLCMTCVGRAVSWDGGMIGAFLHPSNLSIPLITLLCPILRPLTNSTGFTNFYLLLTPSYPFFILSSLSIVSFLLPLLPIPCIFTNLRILL